MNYISKCISIHIFLNVITQADKRVLKYSILNFMEVNKPVFRNVHVTLHLKAWRQFDSIFLM